MDSQQIAVTIVTLQNAQVALYDAIENDIEAQHTLEDRKAQAIIDGAIVGKNAEERDAKAAQVLADQIGAQRVTAAKVRHAKMMLDRAASNWDCVRYTIRMMEVEKQA